MTTRRELLKGITLVSGGLAAATRLYPQAAPAADGPYTLPPLPYAFDALEPYIDSQTMQIHHDRHHATYVANLNKGLADYPDLAKRPAEVLLRDLSSLPEAVRTTVRNQGGGHANHALFWKGLSPKNSAPIGELAKAIDANFGSFASLQDQLAKAATGVFGSGWAWLCAAKDGKLSIVPTSNQDSPLSAGLAPLLVIDVWEHAYYLKYQNRRADYLAAIQKVLNWDYASGFYAGLTRSPMPA